MSATLKRTPKCTFTVTFRETEQFYKVVKWLNANVGQGKEFWSIEGRVLKHLRNNRQVTSKVHIFKDDFEKENALYLTLI